MTYGIPCDYAAVKTRPPALKNDDANLPFPDATIFALSMTDLADRLSDALELGIDRQSNVPRLTPNSRTVAVFHSFMYTASEVTTMSDKHLQVLRNGMMRVAFCVSLHSRSLSKPYIL